jgi:hypothetical protein
MGVQPVPPSGHECTGQATGSGLPTGGGCALPQKTPLLEPVVPPELPLLLVVAPLLVPEPPLLAAPLLVPPPLLVPVLAPLLLTLRPVPPSPSPVAPSGMVLPPQATTRIADTTQAKAQEVNRVRTSICHEPNAGLMPPSFLRVSRSRETRGEGPRIPGWHTLSHAPEPWVASQPEATELPEAGVTGLTRPVSRFSVDDYRAGT